MRLRSIPRGSRLALTGVPLLSLAVFVACQIQGGDDGKPPAPGATSSTAAARPKVSPAIDVAAIRTRFHFAFHDDGGTFSAGHSSHVVHATARGFTLAPIDAPPSRAAVVAVPGTHPGALASTPPQPIVAAPLAIDAAVVTRGGAPVAEGAPAVARVDEGGALAVDRGALHERLENGAHGVEQSWTFDAAPGGAGDLELRLAVHGEDFARETNAGLHFVDRATGRGVAYGVATWVGADGTRTEVRPTFEGGQIVLRVPDALLARTAYPATLDPNVTPEHEVDQPIFGTPSDLFNADPAIDFDGTNYLVAWSDMRAGMNGVYAIHVGADGSPLESAPIVVTTGYSANFGSPAYTGASELALAFDGTNHLVTYVDQRNGRLVISGKRVSKAGAVLDAAPLAISPSINGDAGAPSVAFDGTDYFVVWHDSRNAPASPFDVFGARVTPGGSILNASSIKISGAAGSNVNPKVAIGGGGQDYVVWTHDDGATGSIFGALLSTNGAVVSTDVAIAVGSTVHYDFLPNVAGWGGGFLVSYLDSFLTGASPAPSSVVTTVAIGTDGKPTGAAPPQFTPIQNPAAVNGIYMYSTPSVAFDAAGTAFDVVWSAPVGVAAQRVSTANLPIATTITVPLNDDEQNAPGGAVVATGGAKPLIAAHTRVTTPNLDVYGAVDVFPLDFATDAAVPRVVSLAANREQSGSVASDGSHYLVVFDDWRAYTGSADTGIDVYGVILDANGLGTAADGGIDAGYPLGNAFPIVTMSFAQTRPLAAFDGTNYFVMWSDQSDGSLLDAKRVSPQGLVLTQAPDGNRLGAMMQDGPTAVVYDGTSFLVAWQDLNGVLAAHFTASAQGALISMIEPGPTLVASGSANSQSLALASDGAGSSLLVWSDPRTPNKASLFGALLPDPLFSFEAGVPDGGFSGGGFAIGPSFDLLIGATATYDVAAKQYRVVWSGLNNGPASSPLLELASVTPPSTVSAPTTVSPAGVQASLTYDGKESLVVWTDLRVVQPDVYGARIDHTGAVVDPTGFPISATPNAELLPVVAGNDAGAALVSYTSMTADRAEPRVRARVVTSVANEVLGAGCTGASDCASGFCVDGVCCDKACGGSDPTKCAVCAAALGATADGTCTVLGRGHVCRQSSGDCDLTEVCDGTSLSCPTDVPAPNGALCSFGTCMGGMCVATGDASAPVDAGIDSGIDAGIDAGQDAAAEGGADAAVEGGAEAGVDAGQDAGVDAAVDAGLDAGHDAGVDAGHDAGQDAGVDAAVADSGVDAGPPIQVLDAAPPAADGSFDTFTTQNSGCSCRTTGTSDRTPLTGGLSAGALALGLLARRRRRK